MYIAPSPNAEIINQAAAAVVEAQQRESSMRTEAERVVLTTQAQAAQRESSLRSEAERVVLTTQAEAERALLTTQAQAAQRESSLRSEAERAVLTTQAQATEAVASMRLEFESRGKGLLDEIYRLRSLVAGGIDIRDQMSPNGTDLNNKIDQLIQRMTSFESQMLERMTTFEKDLATIWQRVLALETWEINEHVPEHDTDEELVPGFQATSQPVSPARVQRPPVQPRVDQDSGNEQDASVTTLEDACLR